MCPGGQREELSWCASRHSGWGHLPGYSWGLREELFRRDVGLGVGGRQGAFGVCCPDRAGAAQAKDLSGEQGVAGHLHEDALCIRGKSRGSGAKVVELPLSLPRLESEAGLAGAGDTLSWSPSPCGRHASRSCCSSVAWWSAS